MLSVGNIILNFKPRLLSSHFVKKPTARKEMTMLAGMISLDYKGREICHYTKEVKKSVLGTHVIYLSDSWYFPTNTDGKWRNETAQTEKGMVTLRSDLWEMRVWVNPRRSVTSTSVWANQGKFKICARDGRQWISVAASKATTAVAAMVNCYLVSCLANTFLLSFSR